MYLKPVRILDVLTGEKSYIGSMEKFFMARRNNYTQSFTHQEKKYQS